MRPGLDVALGASRRAWLPGYLAVLRWLLALVAALAIGQVILVAALRIRYPFQLEWMEGAVVDHVRVVLSGQPLYREPSLDFTPFIYPPLYYYVCAGLSRVLGVGFFVPRLVSSFATVASLFLIGSFVRREGGGRREALVAAGLFAATYERSGSWMDLGRVDSLFVAFVLGAAFLARHGRSWRAAVACGLAMFLAFFTKQTALALSVAVLGASVAFGWRRGVVATATFVLLSAAGVLWMNRCSAGWFSYYVFDVPSRHAIQWTSWRALLVDPFWTPMVVPVLLTLLSFVPGTVSKDGRRAGVLYGGLFLVAVFSAYASLLHLDGFANVLMPYHAAVSLGAGVGLAWVMRSDEANPGPSAMRLKAFALVALVAHFAVIAYDHRRVLPTRRDVGAGHAMIARLHEQPGPVLMIGAGSYNAMAGHPELSAHVMALADVFKTHDPEREAALLKSVLLPIRTKHFRAIIVDNSFVFLPERIVQEVHAFYRLQDHLLPPNEAERVWPKTGFMTRPDEVWVPR
jgi:4-amino-4-deoxy-L-arabinose transferase-like glycosyltransferase